MPKPRSSGITSYSREERESISNEKNQKYTTWDDETDDTHSFDPDLWDGDRADAQRAFVASTSNTNQVIEKMSYADREAFRSWARGSFMDGQQYGRFYDMTPDEQRQTRSFDKILDQVVHNEGFVVARLATGELLLGAGNRVPKSLAQLKALEGQIVTSKGSMSTSMAKHGLPISWSKESARSAGKVVEYKIRIPAGSRGAGMYIGDKRVNPGWEGRQREFMTNRNSGFRVDKVTYDRKRDLYVADLTWVGHEKHTYD